ncbi:MULTISPECIES: hypothetical protein [unclassified Ornithinimicrobium]|uniref:hypothetical protein n=1 Tax=unclassified Ornithinimicrobium TaxID=2615080 RepID=UPI003853E9E7
MIPPPAEDPPRGSGADRQSGVARRTLLLLGTTSVGLLAGGAAWRTAETGEEKIPLYSSGVAFDSSGTRVLLAPDHRSPPGSTSRVRPGARGVEEILLAEVALLAATTPLVLPRWHEMVSAAVLDLNVLSHGLAAPVAAWTDRWRYVWPRDTAHVCRVLARLGRGDDVVSSLRFLAAAQRSDGHFEARYTLAGGVPDDRSVQADGVGWFLWAVHESCAALPERRPEILSVTREAAARALRAVYRDLDGGRGLPTATPDYWEVPERRTTLGVAALTLLGLQSASRLGEELCPEAGAAGDRADRLLATVRREFGRRGFQRYVRGGGHDAAITFLLPPYVTGLEADVATVLGAAWDAMSRPAGGVAPGAGWKDEHISWTPETALFAQAWAELGRSERAGEILDWLDEHRTPGGSLPEKVLGNGAPAAVAPLAWTCAVVSSTAFTLSGRTPTT